MHHFPVVSLEGRGTATGTDLTTCVDSDTTMCLNNNRFAVSATWTTADGNSGPGHMVKVSADTGLVWFFAPSDVEVVAKILNG